MNRLRNPRFRYAVVLSTAAALAAVLIGASQVGARDAEATAAATNTHATAAPIKPEPSLFAGIEQRGAALGSPKAPVTLVEYADLQCPYCAQWARDTMPTLVEDYVKTGKLRIVFHGLAFIGADSDKALRTAIAAGAEDHLWDVVHGLYLHQGHENAGWVTDDLVVSIAAALPGLDGDEAPRDPLGKLGRPGARARCRRGAGRRRQLDPVLRGRSRRAAGWNSCRSTRSIRRGSFRRSRRCSHDERAHPATRSAPRSPCSERRSPAICSTCARPAASSSAPPAAARPCRAPPTPRCSACPSPGSGSWASWACFLLRCFAARGRG